MTTSSAAPQRIISPGRPEAIPNRADRRPPAPEEWVMTVTIEPEEYDELERLCPELGAGLLKALLARIRSKGGDDRRAVIHVGQRMVVAPGRSGSDAYIRVAGPQTRGVH